MKTRNLICVSCPTGCAIHVELSDGGEVLSVTGNTCKRGEEYARAECLHPERMVTSTVRVEGAVLPVVPVRTSAPIPKEKIFDCMKAINHVTLQAPVRIGDVVVRNVVGNGADVVATNETRDAAEPHV